MLWKVCDFFQHEPLDADVAGVLLFNWVFQEVLDARRHSPARDTSLAENPT